MKTEEKTIKNIILRFKKQLQGIYEEGEIIQLCTWTFLHYLGWSRADLHLNQNTILGSDITRLIEGVLTELQTHKPIQYILGELEFNGLTFNVNEKVLIPRRETEELIRILIHDQVQKKFQDLSILDIGTGSGCIALSLKSAFPYAGVMALDNSEHALELTNANAGRLKLQVFTIHADILDPNEWRKMMGYDLIVSNPPYIPFKDRVWMKQNVLRYEPPEALFVPDEDPLLFYKAIGIFAFQHLIRPGSLYLEIHEKFGNSVKNLLLKIGFSPVTILNDMQGKERFIRAEAKTTMLDQSYWMADK